MSSPRPASKTTALTLALTASALVVAACTAPASQLRELDGPSAPHETFVPPPLVLEGTAYEAAGTVPLPEVPPGNYPGIHNVFRLSDRIISGSEPHDAEALAQLAAWGVKTVISVDGKVPDLEGAAASGLEYVHIPIRYGGITDDEVMQIAKSFRELEGPFYVHCFHGRHRGPAAAAIGRVALDGLERDVAIAEMRQWCSTAAKYDGLYSTVATARIPSAAETAAYEFDFAPAHQASGMREGMIVMTRVWDEVKIVRKNGWRIDPEHPDVDPLQSATIFAQLFRDCDGLERPDGAGEDFEEMLAEGLTGADRLVELLTDCRAEGLSAETKLEELELAYDVVSESCLDCHVDYRNRPR